MVGGRVSTTPYTHKIRSRIRRDLGLSPWPQRHGNLAGSSSRVRFHQQLPECAALCTQAERRAGTRQRNKRRGKFLKIMVGTGRFELPTPRTPSECSTRLSHVPTGFELAFERG